MAHKTKTRQRFAQPVKDELTGLAAVDAALIEDLTSPDLERRLHAQHGLVNRGRAAVPILLEALKDDNAHLRSKAAQMLTVIRDPATATALAETLSDDEDPVRWVAAEGLVALGVPGLRAALHSLIEAETISPQLKAAVRHILLKMREETNLREIITPLLAAMHEFEVDEGVLVEAHRSLSRLENMEGAGRSGLRASQG